VEIFFRPTPIKELIRGQLDPVLARPYCARAKNMNPFADDDLDRIKRVSNNCTAVSPFG
jgi:hypothetical protein